MNTTTPLHGQITNWKDDRGFGFITPRAGGRNVFVHISAFTNRRRRPQEADAVTYLIRKDERGRPQAARVRYENDHLRTMTAAWWVKFFSIMLAGLFLSVVTSLGFTGTLAPAALSSYWSMSVIAFMAYARDKSAASKNLWRTSEGTLHLLALLGGWPGALAARHLFRHKSKKRSFIVTFWITVTLNLLGLLWWTTPAGERFLQSLLQAV